MQSWEVRDELFDFGLDLRCGVVIRETGEPQIGGAALAKPVSGLSGGCSAGCGAELAGDAGPLAGVRERLG